MAETSPALTLADVFIAYVDEIERLRLRVAELEAQTDAAQEGTR